MSGNKLGGGGGGGGGGGAKFREGEVGVSKYSGAQPKMEWQWSNLTTIVLYSLVHITPSTRIF